LQLNPISSKPFHYKIHPITSYIDLSKIYVVTECRIRKIGDDGVVTNLAAGEVVAPIQMPGATWIRDLKISINQREIYSSNQLYGYKAFLDTEFSYPESAKDGFLSVTGYHRDRKDPDSVDDEGFKNRKNMFAKSKTVQLISKLTADIFNQNLFLISNVEVDIELSVQPDEFMLIQQKPALPTDAVNRYTFEITDVRLIVKTLDLMDGLSLDIAKRLDVEPARYGVRKVSDLSDAFLNVFIQTMLKSLFISQGRTDFVANVFMEEACI
jgi:hypothetical protein